MVALNWLFHNDVAWVSAVRRPRGDLEPGEYRERLWACYLVPRETLCLVSDLEPAEEA